MFYNYTYTTIFTVIQGITIVDAVLRLFRCSLKMFLMVPKNKPPTLTMSQP